MINGSELLLVYSVKRYCYYPHFTKKWRLREFHLAQIVLVAPDGDGAVTQPLATLECVPLAGLTAASSASLLKSQVLCQQ